MQSLIKILLDKGAGHTGHMVGYGSFLHFTAEMAVIEGLQILTEAKLTRREVHCKRGDGLTPLDMARKRPFMEDDWLDAFLAFLKSVNIAIDPRHVEDSDSESEDDIFIDVLEQQPQQP
ncbi:MAG: hypothetical protein MMC33_006383 [Icmadophila ericetorum]|nr:hypothetical protein [Icmadophila ericetorum]